jgi:hypothetical protein
MSKSSLLGLVWSGDRQQFSFTNTLTVTEVSQVEPFSYFNPLHLLPSEMQLVAPVLRSSVFLVHNLGLLTF